MTSCERQVKTLPSSSGPRRKLFVRYFNFGGEDFLVRADDAGVKGNDTILAGGLQVRDDYDLPCCIYFRRWHVFYPACPNYMRVACSVRMKIASAAGRQAPNVNRLHTYTVSTR